MGKMPSFQFYPGDWMKDPGVRRCSHAARGVWVDMLCLMFECEQRGVLVTGSSPWSLDEVAAAVGGNADVTRACINELVAKGVCRVNEAGAFYSQRMVKDEAERQAAKDRQAKHRKKASDTPVSRECHGDVTPVSQRSSSSSSSSRITTLSHPPPEHPKETHLTNPQFAQVWDEWGRHLLEEGKPLTPTRSESQLYQLASFPVDEAIEIVRFSISRGAKNLIDNGDHRQSSREAFAPRRSARKSPGLEGII